MTRACCFRRSAAWLGSRSGTLQIDCWTFCIPWSYRPLLLSYVGTNDTDMGNLEQGKGNNSLSDVLLEPKSQEEELA